MRVSPGRAERAERSRADLWLWPVTAGSAAAAATLLLARVKPDRHTMLSRVGWPGDEAAASTMLQIVAASSIATISLTYTLTVVALQLSSQQFSPRILRDFMRDRVTKATLAVLVATFVTAVAVLRLLRGDEPVPSLALLLTFLLALASLASVLVFITHITTLLRADTIMLAVHEEASRAINLFYPDYADTAPRSPEELGRRFEHRHFILADRSGFVRVIRVAALVEAGRAHDVLVRVDIRPGDHVVEGTPIGRVEAHAEDLDPALASTVREAVILGYERTVEQDAAYAFRQLTDIAVKALSPGINDPVTAAHCVGHAADLLALLTRKRLGPTLHEDSDGVGRAVVLDRDMRYYLDLACGPIRRYGSNDPDVLVALLRMLRDVAAQARDDEQRREIDRQVHLITEAEPASYVPVDAQRVADAARRVQAALHGDLVTAFDDRAGETRSV